MILRFIIYAVLMILIFITVVHGAVMITGSEGMIGFTVLSDYFDEENGIQLYDFEDETNTTIIKAGHLNLGKFFQDILKVNADSDILVSCANNAKNESFSLCLEKIQLADQKLQSNYETHMRNIKSAIDIAREHGVDYMGVPFVSDFVE